MKQKEQYFMETGLLQSQIILDSRGNLIDGYTSYLLAVKYGLQSVPIRYGRRQIVKASYRPGKKAYSWELPERLIDHVSVGDKALVHTQRGIRVVTVAAVEEYAGNDPEPLRMVIRVKQTEFERRFIFMENSNVIPMKRPLSKLEIKEERIAKDKERFCRAARIERQPMSKERLEMILGYIAVYLGMILIFGFFFTLFYLCR